MSALDNTPRGAVVERFLNEPPEAMFVQRVFARVQEPRLLDLLLANRPLTAAEWSRIDAFEDAAQ